MWRLKVLIQFCLAHLPFGLTINHLLQRMNACRRGGEAGKVLSRIPELCEALVKINKFVPIRNSTVVEVGTGWTPLPTLMLRMGGAKRIVTFDHLRHLRLDLTRTAVHLIRKDAAALAQCFGVSAGEIEAHCDALLDQSDNLQKFLAVGAITYVAPGDAAATGLPAKSVDIYYSHAVLEHVSPETLRAIIREARRVLRPTGVFYSLIGLHDHYNGFDRSISKVNFLKYPEWLWAFFVKNSISYHNRLREVDFIDAIREEGGEIAALHSVTDPEDLRRIRQMKLAEQFKRYTPEELAVTSTEIIIKFPS